MKNYYTYYCQNTVTFKSIIMSVLHMLDMTVNFVTAANVNLKTRSVPEEKGSILNLFPTYSFPIITNYGTNHSQKDKETHGYLNSLKPAC